ncbi:MAG: HAMP domain-containing protein [Ardenticatenaceae bacterium]|nr:HAMP domain-containing protein [Ardenticatenaceae bacterium]MCB9445821.1 HAMP domain-containing protein [Ardenticatenaceae bacterium]
MNSSNQPRLGLFFKLMGAFILIVAIVGVLVTWQARRATQAEFALYTTAAGQRQAQLLAPTLAEYYRSNGRWDGVELVLASGGMMERGGMMGGGMMGGLDMWQMMGLRVLVVDENGRIIADSSGDMTGTQLDSNILADGTPILLDDQQIGTVLVTNLEQTTTQNEQFLWQVNRAILLAVLAASIAALLLGGLLTWTMTRPLRQLTHAAEAISEGDLRQRVSVQSGDEIGDLAAAFNQMSDRLARAERLRRQMTADIAHELRTPLSVIQGNVEALQDGVFPLTAEALEPIRAKTNLLTRLVEDLRQLTLAETGQLPLDKTPTDLAALAQRTLADFRAAAESKQIGLHMNPAADLPPVSVDPQRIEQVLVNLLSNALRHTPAGGRIEVNMAGENGRIRLTISDTGPGIVKEEASNIFERFYRVDQGRTREENGGGSGLGLAVARSIIEAHGGQIGVASESGQGAAFWFTLPIS